MVATKEIKSLTVRASRRTYFIDIGRTRKGDRYLKLIESIKQKSGGYRRHQVMIFEEHINRLIPSLLKIFAYFNTAGKTPNNSMKNPRKKFGNTYTPWTKEDDRQLELLFCEGKDSEGMSAVFKRNPGAIESRIKKLALEEKYVD